MLELVGRIILCVGLLLLFCKLWKVFKSKAYEVIYGPRITGKESRYNNRPKWERR